MPLVTRHEYGTGLSEVPLGTDQNRFDVADYGQVDPTLNILELSRSVCTFVNCDKIIDRKDPKYKSQPYLLQPGDAIGPDGLVLKAFRTTYREHIWANVETESKKKRDLLLMNLGPADDQGNAQERSRLEKLPWPKPDTHTFENKFATQAVYGNSTGFMVGPGLVATAAHAIHMAPNDGPGSFYPWKAVFNLRAERAVSSSSKATPGSSEWIYKFDAVYDMESIISHSGYASRNKDAKLYGSIPDFFAAMNSVWSAAPADPLQDLAIVKLEANARNDIAGDWVPALTVSDAALSSANLPGDYFIIGSPNGLPLKISGRGVDPERSAPKILKPVDGFYANFTCDLDCLGANSGGPVFRRDEKKNISVVGVVRTGRVENWGLSAETSTAEEYADSLSYQGRLWVADRLKAINLQTPIVNKEGKDKVSLVLDKKFFNSYSGLTLYEQQKLRVLGIPEPKQRVIDIARFSE